MVDGLRVFFLGGGGIHASRMSKDVDFVEFISKILHWLLIMIKWLLFALVTNARKSHMQVTSCVFSAQNTGS
jgi:hypothetical protein